MRPGVVARQPHGPPTLLLSLLAPTPATGHASSTLADVERVEAWQLRYIELLQQLEASCRQEQLASNTIGFGIIHKVLLG
jgi:hypothetical protein